MTVETYEVHRKYEGDHIHKSDHKIFQFPGGESHINFDPNFHLQVAYVHGGSGDDLMSLAMWADACKRNGNETIACIPYLPGARMDRGVPLGAKVYADMINAMGIDYVVAVDPHSDVAPALYDRLTVVGPATVIPPRINLDGIIAPDLGAVKRAQSVATLFALPIAANGQKHRDFSTGKLSGFGIDNDLDPQGSYLIVDDICDGGGTFNGLADVIHEHYPDVKLSLWVTHGIFSQGVEELSKRFIWIGTTDSHSNTQENFTGDVEIVPILKTMLKATGRVQPL